MADETLEQQIRGVYERQRWRPKHRPPPGVTEEQRKQQIAALIVERNYLLSHGKTERVVEVDRELHRLGHEGAPPAKRATKRVKKP